MAVETQLDQCCPWGMSDSVDNWGDYIILTDHHTGIGKWPRIEELKRIPSEGFSPLGIPRPFSLRSDQFRFIENYNWDLLRNGLEGSKG
jgi:hypothetical protein